MLDTVLPPQARRDAQIRPLEPTLADVRAVLDREAPLSKSKREAWANGSDPRSVSDATVEAFSCYSNEVQFTVKPRDLPKEVARCWNQAQASVPGWRETILTVPDFRPQPDSLPWDAFPRSLVED